MLNRDLSNYMYIDNILYVSIGNNIYVKAEDAYKYQKKLSYIKKIIRLVKFMFLGFEINNKN